MNFELGDQMCEGGVCFQDPEELVDLPDLTAVVALCDTYRSGSRVPGGTYEGIREVDGVARNYRSIPRRRRATATTSLQIVRYIQHSDSEDSTT